MKQEATQNLTTFIEVLLKGTKPLTEIFNELKSTSSKNEKQAILEREKAANNEELRYIFSACYSPEINFFTKVIPSYENKREIYTCTDAVQILVDVISSRKKTGQAALDYISFILSQTVKGDVSLVESVIKRDMDCGVQTTTINKVWKDLINDPPYLSYKLFKPELLKKLKLPLISQEKSDGLFNDITVTPESLYYSSRAGHELNHKLLKRIEDKITLFCEVQGDFVINGEALVKKYQEEGSSKDDKKWDGVSVLDRQTGNGMLNRGEVDPDDVVIHVWDIIPLKDYKKRSCSWTYEDRLTLLKTLVDFIGEPEFKLVETRYCKTYQEVIDHFVEMRSQGKEGTVVKNVSLLWKDGKTNDGLKLKNVFECEYKITDVYVHEKDPNLCGGISVESSDSLVVFNCGSGLSKEQRKLFWQERDSMVGRIVTIAGNDITSSQSKNTLSVFLPRLIEERVDKTTANSYNEILEAKDSTVNLLKDYWKVNEDCCRGL